MNLIVSATGSLGGMIARRLLEQGQPVRAFVRSSGDYQELEKAGAEIAIGDLRDPASLAKACAGVQRVVATATAPLAERHRQEVVDAVDWHGIQSLIDAAKAAGVEQFVYVTFLGASADASQPLVHAKGANEIYLKESGLPYTILQPGPFMEGWVGIVLGAQLQQGPSVTLVGEGRNKMAFVAMKNVCDLAVAVLGHQAAHKAEIPFNGPGSYSYREVVRLIEQASGQPIDVKTVPPGASVPGLPSLICELWAIFAQAGDMMVDSSEAARTYGIEMVKLEDYVRETFAVPEVK